LCSVKVARCEPGDAAGCRMRKTYPAGDKA
jgi:hypothetical protein